MNPSPLWNPSARVQCGRGLSFAVLLLAACALIAVSANAAQSQKSMVKPPVAVPGGLDNHPYVTAITPEPTNGTASVEWFGIVGPFELEGKEGLLDETWESLGTTTSHTATLPMADASGFLRVKAPDANFVGAQQCALCHVETHAKWSETAHARAFDTLKAIGMHENSSCLQCHTVGYGQPNGYQTEAEDMALAGVQCENCHGPGGSHVANPFDPSTTPVVTIAAAVCGGCHTDAHHPTFDEWQHSLHSRVDVHVGEGFIETGESRMISCGGCHSGAVRRTMLAQIQDVDALFPTGEDAAHFGQTCSTCHNPHDNTLHSQLRNPSFSTEFFSYVTSANLSTQYNPDIQLCGQCHNQRGALWTSSGRPPHHSPQDNIIVGKIARPGTADEVWNRTMSFHGAQPLQCVQCHTHGNEVEDPDEETPNYTGHTFEPEFARLHRHRLSHLRERSPGAMDRCANRKHSRHPERSGTLDNWALTKASEALREKYGTWPGNSRLRASSRIPPATRALSAPRPPSNPASRMRSRRRGSSFTWWNTTAVTASTTAIMPDSYSPRRRSSSWQSRNTFLARPALQAGHVPGRRLGQLSTASRRQRCFSRSANGALHRPGHLHYFTAVWA